MKQKLTIAVFTVIFGGLVLLLTVNGHSFKDTVYLQMASHSYDTVVISEKEYSEAFSKKSRSAEIPTGICLNINLYKPAPLEGLPELIISKRTYVVSYNKETMMPNWVAWQLTGEHTDGPYGRLSNFYEEEEVPSPRATLEDYRGSGWSRGHMCPAGDNKWDERAMYDSFSLVNVCPQNASLNSGLWNSIEISCRKWAKMYGSLYIVCGPIFFKSQEHERIGPNQIPVPEAFFKVILCIDSSAPKGIGFICRNTDGNKKKDFYVNSIRQVERVTGYQFFPNLSDSIRSIVYDMDDINIW